MPGSSACTGAGVPGGRQARTVLSASDRAWRSAAPGPSSSHSRSRAALRTRAMPLRSARLTAAAYRGAVGIINPDQAFSPDPDRN
jgi:hypothetical protein